MDSDRAFLAPLAARNPLGPHDVRALFEEYGDYLKSVADALPPNALAFALATWHYDHEDHRCPHDAWVESLHLSERGQGSRREKRKIDFIVRLLGAYQDGHLLLEYSDVGQYVLSGPTQPAVSHGDWLVDEIRLVSAQRIVHEVFFSSAAHWRIECADVRCTWQPLHSSPVSQG